MVQLLHSQAVLMFRKRGFRNPQFNLIGPTGGPIDEFDVIAETAREP